jgi:F-type H+-transporting ATPase subunit delta
LIQHSIARRYAKGLFSVGEKDGKYPQYLQELTAIVDLFEREKTLGRALMLPLLEVQKRKELLSEVLRILGASMPVANMLRLLLENNRMAYLPYIKDAYGEYMDEKEGRVKGTLWSPYAVDPTVKTRIEKVLAEKLNKEIVLKTVEDRSLIGGLKIEVKGTIIDGSVKKQLENLRENILKE